jgi:NADH:ubiquinone oxidoreductase subunit 4 (subunit M)
LTQGKNMAPDTWLRVIAVVLPLAGALVIWRWGGRFPHAQRWVAAALFGVAGLAALLLFLLNRQYACILTTGRANCLWDGAASLGLFMLDVLFAVRCIVPPAEGKRRDLVLMLLLSGAVAGIGLAQNLLLLIVFLNLLLFVGSRWLTGKGLQPRFLVLRDDYKDDNQR